LTDSATPPPNAAGRSYPIEAPKPPLALLLLLILVIMVPIEFSLELGPLFLTASRAYLIVLSLMILPHLGGLRLRIFDWLFVGHVVWTCVAYATIYPGGKMIEMAGSYGLEFLIVYLATRIYLQTLQQIRAVITLLFVMTLISLAFAIPEAITGVRFAHEAASSLTGITYRIDYEERMGITRAASLFEHPILYGVFCASLLSLVWFTSTPAQRSYKAPAIVVATWLSASSAPLLTLGAQFLLIVIERITRDLKVRRDKLLAVIAGAFFLFVQLFVGRGLVGILALITINPSTAYTRRSQWDYAIDDIMRNPWFGFIPSTYTRPFWLAPSIDNWWLLIMMRSGIPSLVLIGLSVLFLWIAMAKRTSTLQDFVILRRGWGLMMLALILGAATVTFFGKLQPLFAFYMGMGAALATCILPEVNGSAPDTIERRSGVAYTRFPRRPLVREVFTPQSKSRVRTH
jgi:hypothetical protein